MPLYPKGYIDWPGLLMICDNAPIYYVRAPPYNYEEAQKYIRKYISIFEKDCQKKDTSK